MFNFRNFSNHGALFACMLLFAPADADGGGAVSETDPYARSGVDWERFNAVLGENLDTAMYRSEHLKALITSALDMLESENRHEDIHYTATVKATPDALKDSPFLALFGPSSTRDIKVVPHDPDVVSTFRAVADALDAAWIDTTGRRAIEQPNATFRG